VNRERHRTDPEELEILRADPAGNITIFVLSPVPDQKLRAAAVRALLADPELRAEQVGFVTPPMAGNSPPRDCWALEMMGGEFCGNAARSFGLYVAGQTGLEGRHTLMIRISGVKQPLPVSVDTVAGTAEVSMPGPLAAIVLENGGRRFPAYVFEGITHVIAADTEAGEGLIPALLDALKKTGSPEARRPPDALGVMFYDTERRFMRPLVWVRSSGTTVFESSCGSGSAALGVWALRNVQDGGEKLAIDQPGGIIEVQVEKQGGMVRRIVIGGPVSLSGPRRRPLLHAH
jgi:diaminopimelate epimerase